MRSLRSQVLTKAVERQLLPPMLDWADARPAVARHRPIAPAIWGSDRRLSGQVPCVVLGSSAPIGLPRHGAEVAPAGGLHVDADVVRSGVVDAIDAVPIAREAGQRHARARAALESASVDILPCDGAEGEEREGHCCGDRVWATGCLLDDLPE
eukprot:4973913-Prymnesium_polylepis.1